MAYEYIRVLVSFECENQDQHVAWINARGSQHTHTHTEEGAGLLHYSQTEKAPRAKIKKAAACARTCVF
jgi:hypothetical protein